MFVIILTFGWCLDYRDDFNTLNRNFWLVFNHGGYNSDYFPAAYEKAIVQDSILYLKINDIDEGPELINKNGLLIRTDNIITVEWKAKVHYANEYFAGGVYFALVNYETPYDPHSKNYNIPPYAYYNPEAARGYSVKYLSRVFYRNYFYGDYPPPYTGNNFGFCGTVNSLRECQVFQPIWDKWFSTKVVFDFPAGNAKIWINGNYIGEQPLSAQKADIEHYQYLKIHFSPYGWWTGHEMDLDWVKISITGSQGGLDDCEEAIAGAYERGYEDGVHDAVIYCQANPIECGITSTATVPSQTPLSVIKSAINNKTFLINGYFIHYGDDKFDWIYLTADLAFAAKLEGMNPDGSFAWTFIQTPDNKNFVIFKEGDEVTFKPTVTLPGN